MNVTGVTFPSFSHYGKASCPPKEALNCAQTSTTPVANFSKINKSNAVYATKEKQLLPNGVATNIFAFCFKSAVCLPKNPAIAAFVFL